MRIKTALITLSVLLVVSLGAVQLSSAAKPDSETKLDTRKSGNNGMNKPPCGDQPQGLPVANPNTSNGTTNAATIDDNGNSVVLSGGFNTDPQDHGRPVVLIAAALGVPTDVFREAFSGVTPAGTDSGGPSSEQAQQNKAALLKVLAPYGITNERLDEVSNYYRYNGNKGQTWKHTPATATAIVTNGVVTGVKITSAGSGYSSNPTITITGPGGTITATATVSFTEDFKTNGSIASIKLN